MSTNSIQSSLAIEAQCMPHEAYIRHNGEDWAGITNQRARKKLQNRLNKRASRSRRKTRGRSNDALRIGVKPDRIVICSAEDVVFTDVTEANIQQKRAALQRIAAQHLASYAAHQPRAHHLPRLIQLNVIDSLTRNSVLLGFTIDWLLCSAVSPFCCYGPRRLVLPCPGNLVPTALQRAIPHHPWIDLFPLPRMRDNFLVAVSRILSEEEEFQLWDDVIESRSESGWSGLIEMTVPFLRRWAWLLDGCEEILEATNYWRRRRGERCIGFAA
ncbi:hypothetical protein F4810DRAFT_702194 [Camillea tinctor]|nr:hypothetical protein F4810DRAFT_702194 [Camillea tinctor]